MYKLFYFLGGIYTYFLKRKFASFGAHSIVKPFLNSANEKHISIGKEVNIGSFCRITVSTEFGGYKVKSDNKIRIKIGDNVSIGNNTFISANNNIKIGNHVIMSSYVFITDHDHGFQDFSKTLYEQPLSEGGHVRIGDNVFLGTKCSILKNVTIGERSVVSANAVVTKNVPAFSVVAGNPAKIIKRFDFNKKEWVRPDPSDANEISSEVRAGNAHMDNINQPLDKILFLNPPLYFSNGNPESLDISAPPLGSLFLASYINENSDKFRAEIIDIGAEKLKLEEVGNRIRNVNPFVIAISAMTPQLQGALELADFIKNKIKSGAIIFLGGPHISADKDFINRHPNLFDYAIAGEAEKTFLESLNKLKINEEIPIVQDGEVPMNLDEIPIPDRSLIKKELYSSVASMLFSRGCPFQCYYCSRPSISRKVRYRSVDNILKEIKNYQAEGIKRINFQDDTFTMNRQSVIDLCRKIIQERIRIEWHCNTRIDLVDDELLGLMKKAGCAQVNFGIESGNERVRREIIHKGNFTNVDIYKVFVWCRKHGIKIACYFMIGHPTETKNELLETKRMILNSGIDILGLSIPLPFPGSALYEIAKKEGIINEEIIDNFAEKKLGEGYAGVYPEYVSNTLDPNFVHQQMKEINRRFYINFKTFYNQIKQNIFSIKNLVAGAKDLLSLISHGVSSRKPYIKKK